MMEINQSEDCQPAAHHSAAQTVNNARGFTLIELIMVCAIIGVLATLSFGGYSNIRNRTKISIAGQDIRNIEKDIFAYASEKGTYPPDLAAIGRQNDLDPWGNTYVYAVAAVPAGDIGPLNRSAIGKVINTDFDLYSNGSNKTSVESIIDPLSKDDIIRGRDGGYVGTAEHY